ncbi:MAG: NADAR family protein [Oligoflexia bacterium]|nr:NADAR family protein [Oligoflexia bacterium]
MRKLRTFSITFILGIFGMNSDLVAQQNPPNHIPPYPIHWWSPVAIEGAPDWEIFPQEAKYGEVILSKRNELGLLSNFAPTPFEFHGDKFASVEGFWQSLKYPENELDPRAQSHAVTWKYTRQVVAQMTAFDAKAAGDLASQNMKILGIEWVSFQGQRLIYKEKGESPFYKLVFEAMRAKLNQNPEVKKVLLRTGDLILRPDHKDPNADSLMAWRYYEIWIKLRGEVSQSQ